MKTALLSSLIFLAGIQSATALTPRFITGSTSVVEGFDDVTFLDSDNVTQTVDITFINDNVSFNDLFGTETPPSNPNDYLLFDFVSSFNLANAIVDALNTGGELETLVPGTGDGFILPTNLVGTNAYFLHLDGTFTDFVLPGLTFRNIEFGPEIRRKTPFAVATAPQDDIQAVSEHSSTLPFLALAGLGVVIKLKGKKA